MLLPPGCELLLGKDERLIDLLLPDELDEPLLLEVEIEGRIVVQDLADSVVQIGSSGGNTSVRTASDQ